MLVVDLLPEAVVEDGPESVEVVIGHDGEDLVGGGVDEQGHATSAQRVPDAVGAMDGRLAEVQVEIIGEERVKLEAGDASLGEKCAMLLDDGEEVGDGARSRYHDGLAEEGAALGAADVEDVAEACDVGEGDVVGGAGEGVGQPCAVDVQTQVVPRADLANRRELGERVERPVLRGLREVHHARHDHVVAVGVRLPRGAVALDGVSRELAVRAGDGEDLVAAELDGARLVHAHMTGVGGNDALVPGEKCVDAGRVGLRASHEEVDLGVGGLTGRANLLAGGLGVGVEAVSCGPLEVRLDESLDDLGNCALLIVGRKRKPGGCHVVNLSSGLWCRKLV